MKNEIPGICRILSPLDRAGAGWHARNSVVVRDIVPEWTEAGGGILVSDLTQSLDESFDQAIKHTKVLIIEAEDHLRQLLLTRNKIFKKGK